MTTKPTAPTVKLDWSRLLGFDQVAAAADQPEAASRLSDPRLAKLGAKIGIKGGGMRRKNSPSAC